MAEYFKSKEYYPVLLYTGFTEREQEDMRYCTTAEKFKRDLQQMLEAGYRPVSLKKIYHLEHTAKYFSTAMRLWRQLYCGIPYIKGIEYTCFHFCMY